MNDVVIKIFVKDLKCSFRNTGTLALLNMTLIFTVLLYLVDWGTSDLGFYKSINTSLWATLIFYVFLNVFGKAEEKHNKLDALCEKLKVNCQHLNLKYNGLVAEVDKLGLVKKEGYNSFFDLCFLFPPNHVPTVGNLRMSAMSGNQIIPMTLSQSLHNALERYKRISNDLEKFTLALQIHDFDPVLYEKIYKTAPVTSSGEMLLKNRQADAHKAYGSDYDILTSSLARALGHLEEKWFVTFDKDVYDFLKK